MPNSSSRTKSRLKVGIACGYYLPHLGGIERYVDKLSRALMKLGYEIVIITSNHDGLNSIGKDDGRTIYRLPTIGLFRGRYPIPNINSEYRRLISEIEKENIDVFLLNTRFHLTSLIGAKMGKRLRRPVMLIEHGTGHLTVNNSILDYWGKLYEHALTWWIKRFVDRFYGVSKACNVWLRHFGIRAGGVFYNAIDVSDGRSVKDLFGKRYPEDSIVISYAGRIIREKGIVNLLDAFEVVKKNSKADVRLVVAGDGPLLADLRKAYKSKSVDFLGRVDFAEVMSLNQRADIFVYPSLYPEGLPTSILEAGLMNCAVVTTPRGGTDEVIRDGQHGIITDGSVEELSGAIEGLLLDSGLRKGLARALKHKVENTFDWAAVAGVVDKEIRDLRS